MSDQIPFILSQEASHVKEEIATKEVSVIFYGTSRLGEALVIVLRYVNDNWEPVQRLVSLQLLAKSMTGEEIAREIVSTLSIEFGITSNRLLAGMRDRASVNGVAMRTIKVLFPQMLDVGCYAHTLDHVGDHFKTPTLDEFCHLWISLFSHSHHTCMEWKVHTGRAMSSFSNTRW